MAGEFPCPNPPSLCDQEANPSTSFSSEAKDSTTFIGLAWNNTLPPLGKFFEVFPCEGICDSQASQQDADLCAQRLATSCISPCLPVFTNAAQNVAGQCPDGTPYFYTVPAGLFSALSQIMANRMAFTFAQQFIQAHPICLTNLAPVTVCSGVEFTGVVQAVTPDLPVTFVITDGELPPGITMMVGNQGLVQFAGTSNSFGNFTFTLTCTSAFGTYTQKTFTIHVAAITTASPLPDGTTGQEYSILLQALMTFDPIVWSVVAGTLPDGLTLSSDGVLSGTPTTVGSNTFTVQSTDGVATCTKEFTLPVESGSNVCVDGLDSVAANRYGINGYFDGMINNPSGDPGLGPNWDGTFPFFLPGSGWAIGGLIQAVSIQDHFVCNVALFLSCDEFNNATWQIWIGDFTTGNPPLQIWYGEKAGGNTAVGTYNRVDGMDPGPASVDIVLVDMTSTPAGFSFDCVS